MRYLYLICLSLTLVAGFGSTANAQIDGIFTGRGWRSPEPSPPVVEKKKWPRFLDFSRDSSPPKEKATSGFWGRDSDSTESPPEKSSFNWFKKKPDTVEGETPAKPFGSLSGMLPKRDPSQPSVFQQMNVKSRSFLDRTTGWTKRKNRARQERSRSTWDAITKDLRAIDAQNKREMPPAQPPVRSAEKPGQPRVRFN